MKDQHVIACIDRPDDVPTALAWTRFMAEHLRHKGMIALHVAPSDAPREAPQWLLQCGAPYVSLRGKWQTAIEGLPTAFSAILAVVVCDVAAPRSSMAHPKTLLRTFSGCRVAYLCVPQGSMPPQDEKFSLETLLTLTHRQEGKEMLIWASYLARFVHGNISIAHPTYRDEGLATRLQNNLRFADKIFAPLGISYRTSLLASTTNLDREVLDTHHPSILIARTSDPREHDLIDWLMPSATLTLLRHPSRTPILLLNPRDDLYILCD